MDEVQGGERRNPDPEDMWDVARGRTGFYREHRHDLLATPRIKDLGESAIVGNLHATNTRIDRSIAQDGCQRGEKAVAPVSWQGVFDLSPMTSAGFSAI